LTKQKEIVLFNDEQRLCLQARIMRLTNTEALAWLKTQGHDISEQTFMRRLNEVNSIKDAKILQIASRGLFEQHMERIENLELVLKLSWRNYHKLSAKDPFKAQKVLDSIAMQQPLLSQYYEATKFILKEEYPELISEFEKCKITDPHRILKIFQKKDQEKMKLE